MISIFKQKIKKACDTKEFIKLIFQYPNSDRAIIKRGIVIDCQEDGFEFEEIKDGLVTYSYLYLVEIKLEERTY